MKPELNKLFSLPDDLDPKSYDILVKELAHQSSGEFDYIKFKQSLIALLNLNIDEKTAMQSAFMTASTIGLDKNKLLQSAENSIQILHQEKDQFSKALEKQIKERIENRQKEIQNIQEKIAKYQHQIEQLHKEIALLQQKMENAIQEMTNSKDRIMQSRGKFEKVYEFLVREIENDIEKFKDIL